MSHAWKQILTWSATYGGWPSHKIWTSTEEHDDASATRRPSLKPPVDSPPMRSALNERCGRCHQSPAAALAQTPRLATTVGVGFSSSREHLNGKPRLLSGFLLQLDRPEGPTNGSHILGRGNFLMS